MQTQKTSLLPIHIQQIIYWNLQGITGFVKQNFRVDLLAFIKSCTTKEDKIIIMLDENKNMKLINCLNNHLMKHII